MAVSIQPLADRVLVQPIEEKEVKKGGIIIPDTAKEKPQEAKVIALGTGKLDDEGKKMFRHSQDADHDHRRQQPTTEPNDNNNERHSTQQNWHHSKRRGYGNHDRPTPQEYQAQPDVCNFNNSLHRINDSKNKQHDAAAPARAACAR
jgi:chaperonin GroES